MSDTETELELIGGSRDSNGDELPQRHPIENPGDDGGGGDDPIAEPHPDEPGMPEPGVEPEPEPAESDS